MAKRHDVEQGSLAWYNLRLGIPTASNFHKIITPTGKVSAQGRKYVYRLVAERLLRETMDDEIGFVKWVGRGKEIEPQAIARFQFATGLEVEPGAFYTTDDERFGASPDRVTAKRREGVEVKCPAPWTQIGYYLDGPGDDYRPQVQGQMLVAEFDCVHFWAYHPNMPPYELVTLPDERYQATMRDILGAFMYDLERATVIARDMGAYAVMTRVETPADVAYREDGDAPLKIIIPGKAEENEA